jgi:N-acyl homoserine lactone hydrolase
LIDHAGARYEELDGEAEILPGITVLPTPGHTEGHQSVIVAGPDGTLIVAGQTHDNATLFTGEALAHRDGRPIAPWMAYLLSRDPRQVLFAHDNAVWTP